MNINRRSSFNFPCFKSGTDSNGDGKFSLSETDVCNTCHSPGGTYDGVNDATVDAKTIWATGAYVSTSSSTLRAGKEKWCTTCHDEQPSVTQAIAAPNVVGDEDGAYTYGTGWGYYKTGHGLAADESHVPPAEPVVYPFIINCQTLSCRRSVLNSPPAVSLDAVCREHQPGEQRDGKGSS